MYIYIFTVFNKKIKIFNILFIFPSFFFYSVMTWNINTHFFFYPLIPSCLKSVYILFIYTSITAQTRDIYRFIESTEGTGFFFLKESNISNWLMESAEIDNSHLHVQNFINKAHFHRNWYSLPIRFLDILNLFFI